MASLNQISQSYISAIGKDYDYALQERIKFAIKYWRAKLIRQEFERNPPDTKLKQSFVMGLINTDDAASCLVQSGCNVKRTTTKVPTPITVKSPDPFSYVGPAKTWMQEDVLAYKHVSTTGKMIGQKYTRYTKTTFLYEYLNGYVYTNNCLSNYILFSGYFEEPERAVEACVDSVNCITDDDNFPIGMHMLDTILQGLAAGELKMITPNSETEAELRPSL